MNPRERPRFARRAVQNGAKTAAHPPGVMRGGARRADNDQAERKSGTARRKALTPVPPRLIPRH